MRLDPLNILSIDAHFRSLHDRNENAAKNKLRGLGRQLYLERKVKLSKLGDLLESGKGLANMKIKDKKESENE